MKIDIPSFFTKDDIVGVAVSGGSDSMALLHYLNSNAKAFGLTIVVINVEHGIRGKASLDDTLFVKNYCANLNIPFYGYTVDSVKKSKEDKISIEHSARILRYQCFLDALSSNKCTKIATAHHTNDNTESVLINLFRGTGLKGVSGIQTNRADNIVRPMLNVPKKEILKYIEQNNIPFCTDQTNFDDDLSRNYLRLNIIPQIEKIFPEAQSNILRFSEIAKEEDEFLDKLAQGILTKKDDEFSLPINVDKILFNRASIIALKNLGIEKDWEKAHIERIYSLIKCENGAMAILPKNIVAFREYDNIIICKSKNKEQFSIPFSLCDFEFFNQSFSIKQIEKPSNLKNGLFADLDKIPKTAKIRTRLDGDTFKKYNGGTKKLNDYFTDIKTPLRIRDFIPVLAENNNILAIFGIAISDDIKIDQLSTSFIQFIKK